MNTPSSTRQPGSIMGHPEGLFFLFFTEMWERFSYYGMRSLLVLFLVSSALKGGWSWDRADALNLYGTYTFWVYVTGIVGGYIADRFIGARKAVIIGGFIISAGHICLAMDTHVSFYLGLTLVVIGTGLFKPNISTIVGQLYGKGEAEDIKRDAGYTLFYMGVNSGAFFGFALCGYIGEKISWPFGFGLAGFFMILGALQFYFAQGVFGEIGGVVKDKSTVAADEDAAHIVRDRLIAIGVFSTFTIIFWMMFEQAGGSMTIFAADYTSRALEGSFGLAFKIVNTLLMVVPTMVLTWVLVQLTRATMKRYPLSNICIYICFAVVWGLLIWMLVREFQAEKSEIPATWFGILNSFFIIVLAPLFSKMWQDYWKPSGPIKFAVGLVLLGLGFGFLAFGAMGIPAGARTASVSMIWLVMAYLFHTMGELCLSPVGLSYISKLAPARLFGAMFGVWFLMTAIGNKLAGMSGSLIDDISSSYSLSVFFLIFTILPIAIGLLMLMLNKWMLRKMHGVY
ncbi:POT family proton-dependent oligopeptide transporter [Oxalobacteraceae bacterium GrIS 2.11]